MSKIIDIKRMQRIRKKLKTVNKNRFRLSIYRSSKNISAQIIDDKSHKTLVSASSNEKKETNTIKKSDLPNKNTEIFVIGRVGELGLWYKLSFVSFIGNSLNYEKIKTGKNPYEALQAKSIVIHGPKMLEPGYERLSDIGVSDTVNDRVDISRALVKYSVTSIRKPKIATGTKLIRLNTKIVHNLVGDIYNKYKKKGAV